MTTRATRWATAGILAAALLAALWPGDAAAQRCEPKTWRNPAAPGSERVEVWELDGRVDAWWCPVPAPADAPAGTKWYSMFTDGGLYALGWDAVRAAAPRVLAASDPWGQYQLERAAIVAAANPTPAQNCRRDQIAHSACVALRLARLAGYPGSDTAAAAMQPGRCGPAPTCSTAPTTVWRTPAGGSSVYPVAGTRIGPPIAGRRAPGNAACDIARFRYIVSSYTYGTLANGPATEAVLCVQSTQ